MKANRDKRKESNDGGEIGIGTMIVFIAAVIVAAIAAAVLVNTAGNLERQASETGQETTEEVAASMFVDDTVGAVSDDGTSEPEDHIHALNWTVSLAPGANPVDLEEMVIRYQTNATLNDLTFSEDADVTTWTGDAPNCDDSGLSQGFCVINIKQADDGDDYSVLAPGDRIHIYIDLTGDELYPRSDVDIRFMPEVGQPVQDGVSTPSSYGDGDFLILN